MKAKRLKPRNPLVPVVRGKRAVAEPSKRAYTRKPKHKTPIGEPEDDSKS